MYSHTKKVGSVGRFGVRTGKKTRDEVKKIEESKRNALCPSCSKKLIERKNAGIWECRFCKIKFAGGSYTPTTEKDTVIG